MSFVVRHATVRDARAIAEVHVRSWEAAYRGLLADEHIDYFTVDRREQGWVDLLAEPGDAQATLVAVDGRGGAIAGFSAISAPGRDEDSGPRTGEVAALYVDPAFWRGGAGRALMLRSLAELLALGCDTATVWVLGENARARAFYSSCGFEADGKQRMWDPILEVLDVRLRVALAPRYRKTSA